MKTTKVYSSDENGSERSGIIALLQSRNVLRAATAIKAVVDSENLRFSVVFGTVLYLNAFFF